MHKKINISPQVLLVIIAGYFFLLGVAFTIILSERIESILTPDYQSKISTVYEKPGELSKDCKSDNLKITLKIPVNWTCEPKSVGEQAFLDLKGPNSGQVTSLGFTNDMAKGVSGCSLIKDCIESKTYNKSGTVMTLYQDSKSTLLDWVGTYTVAVSANPKTYVSKMGLIFAHESKGNDADKQIIAKILDTLAEVK